MKSYLQFAALVLGMLVVLAGCDIAEQAITEARQAKSDSSASPLQAGDTVKVASFNIQVFGDSKSKKQDVMEILAEIMKRFDVIAVQELRTKNDQQVLGQLVDLVNADGREYSYIAGPRLGRSSSKEQYVFVYNTRRIVPDLQSAYTVHDPQDLMHREPLVVRFRVNSNDSQAFQFTLVNIHTDPDETKQELDALGDVFLSVRRGPARDDDIILLGDLNVNHKKLGRLGTIPNIMVTVEGQATNTRKSKSYDNIVFDATTTREFTGRAGVMDLMTEYNHNKKQELRVSDHMPVWAEFSAKEDVARLATIPE